MISEEAANFRTMFIFNPPNDLPQGWYLTFSRFTEALRNREPEADTRQWSGKFSGDTLSFTFTTTRGGQTEGMVGIDPNGVAIEDCTAGEAAEFAHWLQQGIVPAHGEVRFSIRETAEWELPQEPLPRAGIEELEQALTDHVRRVLEYEEQQLG